MKFLITLKTIFILGTISMLAGGVFVVVNHFAGLIFHPALVTSLVAFGAFGIFCGIAWYDLKEKRRIAAEAAASTEKPILENDQKQ